MTERKRRILAVDDDRLILKMLEDLFADEFDVITADDGEKALSQLEGNEIDAIICDQMMPKITGVEVLRRSIDLAPRAVRVLITASEAVKDIGDAVNLAHVHRVIVKPFRHVEVEGLVKGALREAHLERQNAWLVEELQQALQQLQERERELEHELKIRTEELRDVMAQMKSGNPG